MLVTLQTFCTYGNVSLASELESWIMALLSKVPVLLPPMMGLLCGRKLIPVASPVFSGRFRFMQVSTMHIKSKVIKIAPRVTKAISRTKTKVCIHFKILTKKCYVFYIFFNLRKIISGQRIYYL